MTATPQRSLFGGGPGPAASSPIRDNRDNSPSPAACAVSPAAKSSSITLVVKDADNSEISLKMRRDRPLTKLFNHCAGEFGKAVDQCRFMVDGTRITSDQTPDELDMEDGDIIEVFTEQIGGCLLTKN